MKLPSKARRALAAGLLLVGGAGPLPCQATDYRTDRLAMMAERLGHANGIDTLRPVTFKGDTLRIDTLQDGAVGHIGYRLFQDGQRKTFGTIVCNFIERYLLELDLGLPTTMGAGTTASERMQLDDVTIAGRDSLAAYCADSAVSIHLNITDARGYTMQWLSNGKQLAAVTFPVEYDLMMGVTMDERERRLPEELGKTAVAVMQPPQTDSILRKAWNDNYYTLDGGHYLLESLSGDSYYEKDADGRLRPIFRPQLPVESVVNLLLTGLVEGDYGLSIRLRKYGFKTEQVETTPAQWLAFCRSEGCKPYFGLIALNDDEAVCELIMHCPAMGFNHVMRLKVPLNIIEARQGTLTAQLTAYVTASRIKNLFEDSTK